MRLIVQPYDEDEDYDYFFILFLVMEHSGKTLSHCHFAHHKSHMDWPGIEPGPLRWEAGG
jgi:hypothetical protein